jgi:type IV pilus assembly protein PilW
MSNSSPTVLLKRSLRPGSNTGFTLIEMMISITIGLGVLAALVGVLATNSGNSRTNDRTSEFMTNGRYALNSMKQELRQAGFRGSTWAEPNAPGALNLTNECLETGAAAGSFVSNIRQGVWGANNRNPFAANCIPAASYATGNDVVVVRRLAAIPATTLGTSTVYFRSSYAVGQVFQGVGSACTTLPASAYVVPFRTAPCINVKSVPRVDLNDFAVLSYVYYISPFTDSASENPLVPALYRVALQSDGTMARELVASGIERLQVQFGRLTTTPDTQYLNAGTAPLTGSSSDSNPATSDWTDVHSMRIWLLARSATAEPGYVNTNRYLMGDQDPFEPGDGFRRQLFSTVVQLRN